MKTILKNKSFKLLLAFDLLLCYGYFSPIVCLNLVLQLTPELTHVLLDAATYFSASSASAPSLIPFKRAILNYNQDPNI